MRRLDPNALTSELVFGFDETVGGRSAEVLQLARRVSDQALRLDGAAWDRMVLRALMELTGAVSALMVWSDPEQTGSPDGVCYRLGEFPPGYRSDELPHDVVCLPVHADTRPEPCLLLIPLSIEGSVVGAVHLLLPTTDCHDLSGSVLCMLGALIGYARRQVVQMDAAGGKFQSALANRPPSLTDPMTGLFTAGHFHTTLIAELERASRYGDGLSLLLMRIEDGGETLSDRLADRLTATWGGMLPGLLRRMDHAFLLEESTFGVILPRCHESGLRLRAGCLQQAFTDLLAELEHQDACGVGLRLGGAEYQRGETEAALLEQAAVSLAHARETHAPGLVLSRHPLPEDDS